MTIITKTKYGTVLLYCEYDYEIADSDTINQICNGCGAANAKFDFVPDSIYGIKITEACNIHDWMYHFGNDLEDKKRADRVFLNNMIRIIKSKKNQWKWVKALRYRRAKTYYEAVKHFGGSAYWENK